ncbi:hypothetical protein ENU1_141730 [Entamoeba nuttalli P19]|uniref:Uncharacterized protein n=2 Tax=Entamoeba nuttalli TaxID=412467 RepID=K2GZ07_ENTNP|nr:hypothetical protein ENU1_141730 [Entamoeba nuttalli P19]EKE39097.1 hypothetical protein ENU1_141730 [Entamoeba nuttalli P19]|eukprot:XP_008858558.1 hypothetical protein ENU1_141730 [Entamoeba nuttalli P19]
MGGFGQPQTGSSFVKYQETIKEGSNYKSINFMSQFKNKSLIEIRTEDYKANNGNKPVPQQGGMLGGQQNGFGQQQGVFGTQQNGFGQQQGLFGGQQNGFGQQQGLFGGQQGGMLGGQQNGFGQQQGGLFGGQQGGFGTNGFGQQTQGGFGTTGFGQTTGFGR